MPVRARRLSGVALGILMSGATPARSEPCTPIRFDPGKSSASIRGMVPAEEALCFLFDAKAGQTATISVTGRNNIVSVHDVGDARQSWSFRTQARTYRFIVSQLMQAAAPAPYRLTVSIR